MRDKKVDHDEFDRVDDMMINGDPIDLLIDGVLDLHTFSPREVADLLDDYIAACIDRDILDLRIIHGKGKGVLRNRVKAILSRHPQVESFGVAPLEAGGWGATVVRLKKASSPQ